MKNCLLALFCLVLLISCSDLDNKKNNNAETPPVLTDTVACSFAQLAYSSEPQQKMDKFLPGWKIVWNPTAVGGNYAFVATNGNAYVLAFRGSLLSFTEDAFYNWIYNDLNVAVQNKWPYCENEAARVSQGAYLGWQNIEKMKDKTSGETLWTYLSTHTSESAPLLLTGHSLGGNLATIYASYLWWKFKEASHPNNHINVITFAAPAPGNKAFASDFDKKFPSSLRIENRTDIVPKFPCSSRLADLSKLYSPGPSAASIKVGYKNTTTTLSNVFGFISKSVWLLELGTDFSGYSPTNGNGFLIDIPLSGKNNGSDAANWFAEAGYQHSMGRYAAYFGVPEIPAE